MDGFYPLLTPKTLLLSTKTPVFCTIWYTNFTDILLLLPFFPPFDTPKMGKPYLKVGL